MCKLFNFQIESKKLDWKVQSKVGSLDNAQHKAGGGVKKVRCFIYFLKLYSFMLGVFINSGFGEFDVVGSG